MLHLNNSIHEKNRGTELMLKGGKNNKIQKTLKKIILKKVLSVFGWELNFQIEFYIKKKPNISGEKRC